MICWCGMQHPVTMRLASLRTCSMKLVRTVRHQTRAQSSDEEYTRDNVTIGNLFASVFHFDSASRCNSTTRNFHSLRNENDCRRFPKSRFIANVKGW